MMTKRNSMHVLGGMLALLMVAARPANAPTSDVLTLVSPNEEASGHFGVSVTGAGDVNQDGFADLIAGAPNEDPGTSPTNAGRAYVFSGQDMTLLFELVSPNEELSGGSPGFFGISVAGAGDLNRDGIGDLIVGAAGEDPGASPTDAGRAYAFSGQDGSLLFELVSPNEELGGVFGLSVAGLGDTNGDGFPDLIVGARESPPGRPNAGRAYVISGQDGVVLFELVSPHWQVDGYFGSSVAGAGDVNQDGSADSIVGAYNESASIGRAYVFSGQDGGLLHEINTPDENNSHGSFGWSVDGAGDVNQDGFADLIVGARFEDRENVLNTGRAYVFSGRDGSLLFEPLLPYDEYSVYFGSSVAGAGDLNQDGVSDLLIGGTGGIRGNGAGRAYVFSGKAGSLLFELISPNEEEGGQFGEAVADAGDVNQDGVADVVVGAGSESPDTSPPFAGRAYVFLSPGAFRINSGGPNYADPNGHLFVADRAYAPGGYGYIGGLEHTFSQPIGGTDDDPLYQDVRVAREVDADGFFSYRFDVTSAGRYDVTLHLMAPALDGPGNVVMDVKAEEDVIFDDLDVTAEAGGEYQALVKTFAVDVNDGTLDLRFRAVNKAAVVSAIAVEAQAQARVLAR